MVETPVAPIWEAPVEPVVETPVAPTWEAPAAEPVVEAPVVPVWEAPVEPVVETPVAPIWEAPVEPVIEAPVVPVWEAPVEPKKVGFSDHRTWKKASNRLVGNLPEFAPRQFLMHNNGTGDRAFVGYVQQGGVGLGDKVYFDSDYSRPYTVCSVNNYNDCCAKAGTRAIIELAEKVPFGMFRQVQTICGTPTPIINSYNYGGTVQQFFDFLLVNAFPQYEIYADVEHSELKKPINYLFCKNGKPVLAVFLGNSKKRSSLSVPYKASRIFQSDGIRCTKFFDDYRNDTPYVIKRVNEALG